MPRKTLQGGIGGKRDFVAVRILLFSFFSAA
jgi:hypothetical protein